ncbi:type II secretion system protein D precursor [bacterium BMS3Bbin09]|nr:type II secretion system protein D precursor [bacterium BMS3Bbin09]
MKIILIALTCLLFTIGNAFSEEALVPPNTPDLAKEGGKISGNLPPGLSEGAITPRRVKEFLSKSSDKKESKDNFIILNFDNAALKDVINTIGSITNENFILSPGVDARITIYSAKKIPVSEVMSVFESVLEVNGMSLVRSGSFLKIVAGSAAKQKPLEVRMGNDKSQVPDIDRPVTQIISVKYVPVAEISAVLTPMLSQFGSIIPNARNNLLIVNDLSSSIVRLLRVLREIDVNAFQNTRMSFFKPKYSDVQTLTSELTEVLNALRLTGDGIALIPIERINSLVVFSSSPTLLKTVEGWMRKLDEEVMTGQNVFIYPVQNVEAASIATVLNSLYATDQSSGTKTVSRTKTSTAKKTTAKRTISTSTAQPSSGRIEIITFEPTNSLVILAPPGLYREMVETIKRIDVYPREVLIEAIIAEVTLSDSEKLGIQWSVLNNITLGNKEYVTRTQSISGSTDIGTLSDSSPLLAGAPAGGLSFVLFRSDKLASMINALSSKSQVNILSSPRLLVRDREEASIEVGSDVPTATSTTSSSTNDTLTQSIEYRTVGIKLKIKPTINEERTVVLDVEQEVSSKGDNQQVGQEGNVYPIFTTTKAKTSIVVPDKQGIIIGGIMEQTKNKSSQGVPFLSSIPLLGNLFKYSVDTVTKKELIIIINPYVLASQTEADHLTKQFMSKLKNIKKLLKDNEDSISVPDLDEKDPAKTDEP